MSKQRLVCGSCTKKIPVQSFCPNCGTPTSAASYEERIFWEMGQWESSRSPATAARPSVAQPSAQPAQPVRSAVPRQTAPAPRPSGAVEPRLAPKTGTIPNTRRTPARPAANAAPPKPKPWEPRGMRLTPTSQTAVIVENKTEAPEAEPVEDDNRVLLIRRLQRAQEAQQDSLVEQVVEAAAVTEAPEQIAPEQIAAVVEAPEAPRVSRKQARAEAKAAQRALQERKKQDADAHKAERKKTTHRERVLHRDFETLEPVGGETLMYSLRGRTGVSRARLLITNYRVAVVTRRGGVRWIPLEEVNQIDTAWRGAPTIIVGATIEILRFRHRSTVKLGEAVEVLQREVRVARVPGHERHNAELVQVWCDRTAEVWDSNAGRLRLFIRRHPIFVLSWLGALLPLAFYAGQR